jgi:hypothetical protein
MVSWVALPTTRHSDFNSREARGTIFLSYLVSAPILNTECEIVSYTENVSQSKVNIRIVL